MNADILMELSESFYCNTFDYIYDTQDVFPPSFVPDWLPMMFMGNEL